MNKFPMLKNFPIFNSNKLYTIAWFNVIVILIVSVIYREDTTFLIKHLIRMMIWRISQTSTWFNYQKNAFYIQYFNGLDWSLLVKHLDYEDIHNSWLYCFTNPLEIAKAKHVSQFLED